MSRASWGVNGPKVCRVVSDALPFTEVLVVANTDGDAVLIVPASEAIIEVSSVLAVLCRADVAPPVGRGDTGEMSDEGGPVTNLTLVLELSQKLLITIPVEGSVVTTCVIKSLIV
jgi:hypothetical protein